MKDLKHKMDLTDKEYEQRVGRLAEYVIKRKQDEGWQLLDKQTGRFSELLGISGHSHQIDVQIRFRDAKGQNRLWIAECKHWEDSVDTNRMLTWIARVIDIRSAQHSNYDVIEQHMFTTKGYEAGAMTLARYYRIGVSITNEEVDRVTVADSQMAAIRATVAEATAAALAPSSVETSSPQLTP